MSSSNYIFCEVCRYNHDQGRKHRYSNKHKEKLKQILQKFRGKVKKAKESVKDPQAFSFKTNDDISLKFWCYMCQKEIAVHTLCGDVVVANSGMISHLASVEHYKSLGRFCFENNLTKEEKGRLMLTEEYTNRFSEALSKALNKFESSEELNLQTEAAKFRQKEEKMKPTSTNVPPPEWNQQHLPHPQYLYPLTRPTFNPYQNALQQAMCLKSSHQELPTTVTEPLANSQRQQASSQSATVSMPPSMPPSSNNQVVPSTMPTQNLAETNSRLNDSLWPNPSQLAGLLPVESSSHKPSSSASVQPPSAASSKLTNIRENPEMQSKLLDAGSKFGGNIHSGAIPPWLRSDGNHGEGSSTIGPTEEDFKKHLKVESKKKLNPKRVGANFDRSSVTGDNWLPSFGRVWNFGRRKQSRDFVIHESYRKKRKYGDPLEKDPLI